MKNKKLIATVASLCLVLVAVVAAVIGVLAAAQQSVVNRVKVNYTAVANVYAKVSLNGKTEQTAYAAQDESVEFISAEKQGQKSLAFAYTEAGLGLTESDSGLTNKYALYRFTFENENPTHALEVNMTYVQGTAGTNVRLFWVADSSATWAPTLSYTDAGMLEQAEGSISNITLDNTTHSADVYNHANTSPAKPAIVKADAQSTADIQYIYLVVAVVDLNSDAGYDLNGTSNTLTFTLDGYKTPTPSAGA